MKRQHLLYLSSGLGLVTLVALYYLFSSPSPQPGQGTSLPLATAAFKPADAETNTTLSSSERSETVAAAAPEKKMHPSATAPVIPENFTTGPKTPWDKEIISFVNRLDLSDLAKAEHLLARVSTLPPEGKALALDHATKLIPDEDYVRLRPKIFGLASSPELRETVLLDVLTRGETVRMPTLVELLRQSAPPDQVEVREILVAYLDKDYGDDMQGWESAVKQFLVENPGL